MTSRRDLLKLAEWIVAVLLSLLLIVLLVVRATHAGGLWRDESAVVQLAQMPSVRDILANFQHEAFPPLFPLFIRAYIALFGATDTALRVFGLGVGCAVVGAFWVSARLLGGGVPLVALSLISLNTTFLVWGTTVRGYGLGSALVVLIFACVGCLLFVWNAPRVAAALTVSLAAVQVLLYNSVLLIAIAASAVTVLLCSGRVKYALLLAAVCGFAGLSLLPFVPAYLEARDWNIVVRGAPTTYSLWKHFEVALGNPGYSIPAVWYCVAIGLTGVFAFRMYACRSVAGTQLICFALLASGLAVAGCYSFLRILSYTTSAWYYLACTCVIAAALDIMAATLCTTLWLRRSRVVLALGALVVAPFADWSAITERQTNVDLAARTVTAQADAGDLVLVAPWPFGVTFQHYYKGAAPWLTIPNIADHRVHRYDLVKAKMLAARPIDDLGHAVQRTLASGNRVWFVGGLNLPPPGEKPWVLPPAPASRFKWDNRAYTAAWWQQLSVFVVAHSSSADSVALPAPPSQRVNELEQTSLAVVRGWH